MLENESYLSIVEPKYVAKEALMFDIVDNEDRRNNDPDI